MLLELTVQNLLLIEEARLEFAPGLNVLTGETGAGKTILAHALDLLLGGRPRGSLVRVGASEAYVEGVFERPADLAHEQLAEDATEVVLARRIGADGRTRAYLGGRSIAVGELRELAGGLLSFYGQHEHRRLMLAAAQLEILDGACGSEQQRRRADCRAAWAELSEARTDLGRLDVLAGAREREMDLLEFELREIEAVDPRAEDRDELIARRDRLRNLAVLGASAWSAEQAIAGEEGGALAGLGAAAAALAAAAAYDAPLEVLAQRASSLRIEVDDLRSDILSYARALEDDPGQLELAEERLAAIARLERKHGGSIASVLEHAQRVRTRRDELLGAEVAVAAAQERLERAAAAHRVTAAALSCARVAAAPELARAVDERLGDLAMERAGFSVELLPGEPGPDGDEHAQFMIAPNPGVPPAPLREIASGGELSRVMLALLGAVHDSGSATLVFDEIDAGIGGHTARAVGEQLRALARGRQIVAITHLPQVACFAGRHFTIAKDVTDGATRTTVRRLEDDAVVEELVRMLGAEGDHVGARRHARELLRAA